MGGAKPEVSYDMQGVTDSAKMSFNRMDSLDSSGRLTERDGGNRLCSSDHARGRNRLNAHMYRKMKLAPSPTSNCGLILKTMHTHSRETGTAEIRPLLQTARQNVLLTADHTVQRCGADNSPATRQTLWQRGATGEDSHSHLADWTRCSC